MKEGTIYNSMTNNERDVAKYLKKPGIPWEYQKPVFVQDETDRPRVWTPDFFWQHLVINVKMSGNICTTNPFKDHRYKVRCRN